MARLIGYELRPGVAASTYLAFTMDETTAVPIPVAGSVKAADPLTPSLTLDAGLKVQSVPGPGEQAQTFETIEKIVARPEWSLIRPRLLQPRPLKTEYGFFIVNDIANDLKKGDVLTLLINGKHELKKILRVELDKEAKTTTVYFDDNTSSPSFSDTPLLANGTISVLAGDKLDDAAVSFITSTTWKEEDLAVLIEANKWSLGDLMKSIQKKLNAKTTAADPGVHLFRKTASPFGYNAPRKVTYNSNNLPKPISKWKEWGIKESNELIYLDSEYKEILPGSFVGVQAAGDGLEKSKVFTIDNASIGSRSKYGLNAKSTSLDIALGSETSWFDTTGKDFSIIRGINLFVQSEQLDIANWPITTLVKADSIMLDRWYPGLTTGQMIILTGERDDLKGTITSEVMELKEVTVQQGYTILRFTASLANIYIRSTVTISANVALATHGETVNEVIGSGDTSIPFQRFTLRQPPLTHISSAAPGGTETTLKVYVNDILWHEEETFYGHGPDERIYITRLGDDGKTTIIFGDGITGSRLPTGAENIRTTYRKGIGLGGLVKANQLSQLLTRPLGVKAAINPLEAKGAADRENLDEARTNAPLTLLTFERVVSLQDYEDFARAFAGIEKSLATWTWRNQRRCIFLTVAGTNGAAVLKDDTLYTNLLTAIRQSGDPRVHIELASYKPIFFRIAANIKVNSDYLPEKVLPAIEEELRSVFSFKARSFGQPVSLSEVIAVCQQVEGVIAVDIDSLYYSDATSPSLSALLIASIPVTGDETVLAAELLILDPGPIDLKLLP
jgi:hypothetical protein